MAHALQGASHATNPSESKVPYKAQEAVPKRVEEILPDSVHPTKGENPLGMDKSHATGDSIVPEGLQKVVPKVVEDVLPDAVSRFCHCPHDIAETHHSRSMTPALAARSRLRRKSSRECRRSV